MKLGKSGIEEVQRTQGQIFASPYYPEASRAFGFERDSVEPAGRGPSERSMEGAFAIPSLEVDPRGGVALYQAWSNFGEAVSNAGKMMNDLAIREEAFLSELDKSDYQSRQAESIKLQKTIEEESRKQLLAGKPVKEIEQWAKSQWEDFQTTSTEKEFYFKDTTQGWQNYLTEASSDFNLKFYKNFTEPAYIRETQQKDQQTMVDLLDTATLAGKSLDVEPMMKAMQWAEDYKNNPQKAVLDENIVARMDKFKKDLLVAWSEGAIDTNPFRVNQILGQLSKVVPAHLLEGIQDKVDRKVEVAINKAERAQAKKEAQSLNFFQDKIIKNDLTHDEIDQLNLRPELKFKLHKDLNSYDEYKVDQKYGKELWDNEAMAKSKFGQKLTEKENKYLEMHNEHFADTVLSQTPDEKKVTVLVEHYAPMGHLPESVVSNLKAGMNSDNPDAQRGAVAAMSQIKRQSPYLFDKYFKDENSTVLQVEHGLSTEQIKDNKKRALDVDEKVVESQIKEMYKDKETMFQDDMEEAFGHEVPNALVARSTYDESLKRNLIKFGGNQDLARKAARDEVRRSYSFTSVDGTSRLTRHAPELYYGNPYNPDENVWMKEQVIQDARSQGVLLEDGKFRLEVDPNTVGAKKPSYIIWKTIDGYEFPVLNGWYPDRTEYLKMNPGAWSQLKDMWFSRPKTPEEAVEEGRRRIQQR